MSILREKFYRSRRAQTMNDIRRGVVRVAIDENNFMRREILENLPNKRLDILRLIARRNDDRNALAQPRSASVNRTRSSATCSTRATTFLSLSASPSNASPVA